jgi:hypothetical protein
VIPQWHTTVFSRFKPIATILSVFIFGQRMLFFEYARAPSPRIPGNVGNDDGAASLRGYKVVVQGFADDAAPAPTFQPVTHPPNRFLFEGWTHAGRLNRDIGKLPGLGRLPRPPCAARTLDDRDGEESIAPGGSGDARGSTNLKKGEKEMRGAGFRPIPDTGIFIWLTAARSAAFELTLS